MSNRRKVLLIGWDAADWNIATPLLDKGRMPHLERLINEGVMGNIATLQPSLSPLLWTSVATGKLADQHGILDFAEPDPQTAA
jgi:predicted AlkP superfamily phosphohydrolase/phosphomutase